jgi:plastocyanin
MGRIILFGSAVVSVLLVTLAYAVWSAQYEAEQPSESPAASGSAAPGASSSPAASTAASASAQAVPSAAGSAAASATPTVVEIKNLDFGPDLTIPAGTTVTFTNADTVPHTATQGSTGVKAPGARFDLPLPVGGSDSYTFADPGTYQVTCTIHPQMNMTITAQ